MGGKSSPPPPDYSGMESLGREQLQFARDQYAEIMPLARRVADQQMATQQELMQMGREDRKYQMETFRPLEQGLVKEAQEFDTEAYRQQLASKAMADAAKAFQGSQGVMMREATRRGVNPASGAFGAASNANAMGLAAMQAGAANQARQKAEQMGYARRLEVTGLGRGLSGAAQGAYGAATGAGSAGITTSMAPGTQQMQGFGQAGQTMGNVLGSQTSMYNAGMQQQGLDVGGLLTGAAKAYTAFSDRRLKQNIELVGRDERTMLPLYEFEYINGSGRRFLGVMAQDVLESHPDMVFTMPDGFMAVNYAGLGMEMVEVSNAA